jgi:putative SOS response-associated peptidase YedK
MPVILEKKDEDVWLNPDTEPDQLNLLLSVNEHKGLEAYKVSTKVNSPQNQGSELVNVL